MMAVLVSLGAFLIVLLTGASHSYPAKQGFDSSSPYSSNYGANPGSASTGAKWEVPSSSGFAPAAAGSKVTSQTAPHRGPNYYQPSVQREPAAVSYSSNSFAGPVPSGYARSSPTGSTQPSSFRPALGQDTNWAVAPPSPFSSEEKSGRPEASRFASSKLASGPFPPEFQAGELSHTENSYEQGNYESETEEQGFQPPPPCVKVTGRQGFTSEPQPPGLGGALVEYPYDYMFLTGQYPPGTVSHFSSSFEQGRDSWHDTHYIRDYFPSSPSTQTMDTSPTGLKVPQSIEQSSQPTESFGRWHYGQGGATTGQAQPYEGGSLQGSFSQPGLFAQPHLSSPGSGYGAQKAGY